ncbi:peptide/nickel transport system substrate-binding protein [Microbacteriaceae bacterium SG_E_30_P1]|uniref:Peptide/nickel transport system substrate-binding protein n=1 Tax=Antiquaquibacter oligotrophicus TaxID=2880260 RepID=A0ABT6KN06_9MICO|nr:ABC transporter substrate-binding protein [Antiquaquibacter oligotrophicus]MDH6181234.1 peptide/nickel transport system substrate-binding protein [Antiquaquibacter oligotrophicus]UDF13071.1 ABC transporter substrate-binding protein [Antiquaquibacter oligotrophicus]
MPIRSRLALGAVITTAALALLTGCAAPAASENQTLTFAIEGANLSAGHMDPHSSQLDVSALVQRNVLDSLVAQDADGTFVPWLATDWEISDDQLEYTFTLRDDVTFHDGTPFNADAVVANFNHITDPATASAQAASMIGYAEDGGSYVGTEAIDEFTVRVTFSRPYAPFLSAVSTALLGFWSPAVLEERADELKTGGPDISVGTGPFILSEYVPDQEIVYTANPDYNWGPANAEHTGASDIDTLTVRILPETSVRTGALTSGEVQVAGNVTPSTVSEIGDGFTVRSVELPGIPYSLYLNETYGVFADERVREAFSIGFDADAAVESIFFGQYPRAWSILGPTTPNSYDASLEGSWPYDPEKAGELLDAAGWTERDSEGYRTKDGERLSVRWIAWTPIPDDRAALADLIQSDLRDIGFEVVREALEPAAYNEQYGPKTFDLTDWGFSGVDADALRSHLHTDGFQNASQVSDPEVDALLESAVATSDPAERTTLYTDVQQWNAEHTAIVPLYVPSLITAYSDSVEGLQFDLYGRPLFYGASVR